MSLMYRLATHIREHGPGVPYATHDVAMMLGISRNNAATYLRRAAIYGWVEAEGASGHGGSMRRPLGSVVVRYVSTTALPPEPEAPVCSKCGVNAPRYVKRVTLGRVPICTACLRSRNQAKYQRRVARLHPERRVPVRAEPERGHEDISPADIERRFQAALAQIRRRAS